MQGNIRDPRGSMRLLRLGAGSLLLNLGQPVFGGRGLSGGVLGEEGPEICFLGADPQAVNVEVEWVLVETHPKLFDEVIIGFPDRAADALDSEHSLGSFSELAKMGDDAFVGESIERFDQPAVSLDLFAQSRSRDLDHLIPSFVGNEAASLGFRKIDLVHRDRVDLDPVMAESRLEGIDFHGRAVVGDSDDFLFLLFHWQCVHVHLR